MRLSAKMRCDPVVSNASCLCCAPEVQWLTRRMAAQLSRRGFVAGVAASLASLGLPDLAKAQSAPVPVRSERSILFSNVRLFDGVSPSLRQGVQVLVLGDKIKAVDASNAAAPEGAEVIDGGGRTLIPGLIDAHWHTMLASLPLLKLLTADIGYLYIAASREAERTLMRGFTTVRDAGGPAFALKQAIDAGIISGPRIYPSGAMITQTGGHFDFRLRREVPRQGGNLPYADQIGATALADGSDEVLRRTREQLMLGASQIKLAGGGGVSSLYDPLDSIQFEPAEIRAAVQAASDWQTYVTVHIYTPPGIRRYVEAGVRCIEHGHLADEDSVRMLVDRGVWWSLQPFMATLARDRFPDEARQSKQRLVWAGTDTAYNLAIKHQAKVGWGTDILFAPDGTTNQGKTLAVMTRWYTPFQALKTATHDNGELLALCGPQNPYPSRLGVIQPDAYADMLLVDGDPTENLNLLASPERNLKVIMKDGRIYKNTVGPS